MNFGAARLGFWFRQPDRSVTKSKNVLIVYDLNSVHPGLYDGDVAPSTIASLISARETALGFTPTVITSYSAFLALTTSEISSYAHIWDVGYDTLITSSVATKYETYLIGGGAMFFLGENGYFIQRDNTITNLITDIGGGTVTAVDQHYYGSSTIQAEFLLSNPSATVQFYDVSKFSVYGSGTPMVIGSGEVHAVVWKTGSLSNAPSGAICAILDVNWVDGNYTQQNLIDNISIVLNKK